MTKFSLIILTYNSDYEKIILTIKSILEQDLPEYEIIISDDGSQIDFFEELRGFFTKKAFNNYKLIKNEQNLGIVNNFLKAIKQSKGKYIKGLAPADLLYNNDSLSKMYNYLTINNSKFAFGRMKSYYIDKESDLHIHGFVAPKNLKEYKKNSKNRIKILRNLLLYKDWISGVTMFFERDYVVEYLTCLSSESKVKYCEDLIPVLILLNNGDIDFYNQYIVWYEYGYGISTDNNKESSKLLRKDHENFLTYLQQKYGKNEIVRKALKKNRKNSKNYLSRNNSYAKINNRWIRRLLIAINRPYLIFFKLETYLQAMKIEDRKCEKGFLDNNKSWFYKE